MGEGAGVMAKKQTQLEKAIEQIDGEIAVLQAVKARLVTQIVRQGQSRNSGKARRTRADTPEPEAKDGQ